MNGHSIVDDKPASKTGIRDRESSVGSAAMPYPASWVNRLIRRIESLPISSWLFYLALCAILVFLVVAASWIDGSASPGKFALPTVYAITPLYSVLQLAAIQYLDDVARRSLEAFRPALGLGQGETRRLEFKLTTLPAREGRLAAAIGAAFGVLVLLLADIRLLFGEAPVVVSILTPLIIAGFIVTAELLYHTVRQLRLVSHIHGIAAAIDPFQPTPLYAFSRLSAQTGLMFLLIMYFDFVANSETFANPALLALNIVGLPLIAAACFVLPLAGMHRRLVHEKHRLQWEANERLEAGIKQLYQRVDAADLQDADAINKTISSLIMTREAIAKTPTWPWQPGTFTVFFTAGSLPIIVFVIQMFLKDVLGFR